MLVLDDRGFKVWGTVPAALERDEHGGMTVGTIAEKGDRVTFTARLEPSSDDETFGFFKRPRRSTLCHKTTRSCPLFGITNARHLVLSERHR